MALFTKTQIAGGRSSVLLFATAENALSRTVALCDELLANNGGNHDITDHAVAIKDNCAMLLSKCELPKRRVGANDDTADAKGAPIGASNERLAG